MAREPNPLVSSNCIRMIATNGSRDLLRTCADGANFRAEYRLYARDGQIVWVQGECQLITR